MFYGIVIGAASFVIIGFLHPIVIKTEYYIGAKAWPFFLIIGLILCALSLVVHQVIVSAILAVAGFGFLWGIKELKEQEERVAKGWWPANEKKRK